MHKVVKLFKRLLKSLNVRLHSKTIKPKYNPRYYNMKKRYLTVATLALVASSLTFTSCIGSFQLTHRVLNWNNQVSSKFVNELVFIAFWILPVYEVTSLADLLVLNSIEFWSGNNPVTASVKAVDTEQGRYLIACDGKGYTVTFEPTGEQMRLDFIEESDTWALNIDGKQYPFMTFIDDTHVKMISPSGEMIPVELSDNGLMAYRGMAQMPMMAAR